MAGTWRLVSRAPAPIVSLTDAKRQTNTLDFPDDDALLTSLLDVATQHLDLEHGIIGRPLLTQVWQYLAPNPPLYNGLLDPRLRGLPPQTGFVLDRAPLQSVTKVEYLQDGAYLALPAAQYVLRSISSELSFLRMASGVAWPRVDSDEAAWRITVTLGYGDTPDAIPSPIRQAALLLVSHLYQNREAVTGWGAALQETPQGVAALLTPYRVPNS
jgi:uncharacterized phiE125 gp8 family phage protein